MRPRGTTYLYGYDSLGRLISGERLDNGASILRTRQAYDEVNRPVYQAWQVGGTLYEEGYTYNSTQDGSLNTHHTATGETLTMQYDGLRRLSGITGGIYGKSYTYRDISTTQTTTQIASVVYDLPTDQSYGYTYDNMGNIATYTDANGTVTYTYDPQGQLLTATDGTTTYSYTYDTVGNILTANGHTYAYTNADWKDLLTAYDGEAITYDAIGNPLSYYNGTRWTFTWEDGRQLATATDGTTSISYTYDSDGIRTSKTVDGVKHTYVYASGKLLRETYGDTTLDFFYSTSGHPYAMKYGNTVYYYITNLQGDVMQIVNADGEVVASYQYDPYGNIISATGELAEVNPLRYRGYVFDSECDLYYLQSRYYDPSIGRFLNADAYASTGQGVLGHNMFAYCGNNPIVRVDPTGYIYRINESDLGGAYGGGDIATALFVGTLFTAGQNAIQQTINYYVKDITEFCKTAADYLWTQFDNRQPRIHHVIPKGDFSQYGKETQQQLKAMHKQLADAGIGINDPQNLVIISHGSHKSMHTKTYISNIYSIMMVAKDGKPWEVRVMLYFAREYAASQDKYSIGF